MNKRDAYGATHANQIDSSMRMRSDFLPLRQGKQSATRFKMASRRQMLSTRKETKNVSVAAI